MPSRAVVSLSMCIVGAMVLAGCAYPRRATSITVARGEVSRLQQPPNVWKVTLRSVAVPPTKRSGMAWDDQDGPDTVVRLFRGEELLFEWPVRPDTLTPRWDMAVPDNVKLPPRSEIRLEVWDQDGVSADPVGVWRGVGLPDNAQPGADVDITLEGGAIVTMRIDLPVAHRGVGVKLYEVRSDALVALQVIEFSPAGRAGVRPGDRITAIDSRQISDLSEAEAASAISLAAERNHALAVERPDGSSERVELDSGPIWLTR